MLIDQVRSTRRVAAMLQRQASSEDRRVGIVPSLIVALDEVGKKVASEVRRAIKTTQKPLLPRFAFLVPGTEPSQFSLLVEAQSDADSFCNVAWKALNDVGDYVGDMPRLEELGYSIVHKSRAVYFVGSVENMQLAEVIDGRLRGLAIDSLRLLKERGIDQAIRVALLESSVPPIESERQDYYQRLRQIPWRELLTHAGSRLDEDEEDRADERTETKTDRRAGSGADEIDLDDLIKYDEPPLTYCYVFSYQDNREGTHSKEDIQACMQQALLSLLTSALHSDQGADVLFDIHAMGDVDQKTWDSNRRVGTIGTARFVYPRPFILDYCAYRLAGEVVICRGLLPPRDVPSELMPADWAERLTAETERFDEDVKQARAHASSEAAKIASEIAAKTRVPVSFPQDVTIRRRRGRRGRRNYREPFHSDRCEDYKRLLEPLTLAGINFQAHPNTWLGNLKTQRLDARCGDFREWAKADEAKWAEYWEGVSSRVARQADTYVQKGIVGIAQAQTYLAELSGELEKISARADQESQYEIMQWNDFVGNYLRRVPAPVTQSPEAQSSNTECVSNDEAVVMAWLESRPEEAYNNVPHENAMLSSVSLAVPLGYYALHAFLPIDSFPPIVQWTLYATPFAVLLAVWTLFYISAWRNVERTAEVLRDFYRAVVVRRIEATEHQLRIRALSHIQREGVARNIRALEILIQSLQELARRFDEDRKCRENDVAPPRDIWGIRGEEFVHHYNQVDRSRTNVEDDASLTASFLDSLWTTEEPRQVVYLLRLPEDSLHDRLFRFCRDRSDRFLKGGVESLQVPDPTGLLKRLTDIAIPLAQATPIAGISTPRFGSLIFAASENNVLVQQTTRDLVRYVPTRDPDTVTLAQFIVGFWPRLLLEAGVTGVREYDMSPAGDVMEPAAQP